MLDLIIIGGGAAARPRCRARCRQPRRAAADDNQIQHGQTS